MQMTIIEQKQALRKYMLQKRQALDSNLKAKYDAAICAQLETQIESMKARIIHAYLPMGAEINIRPLLENLLQKGITIATPKTLAKPNMENRILTSFNDLENGVFGTKHPAQPNVFDGSFDLIIIPGLAFDSNNYRLGYGGGYYDTFLKSQDQSIKLGVFYPFQKVFEVPIEKHDIQLDGIITVD